MLGVAPVIETRRSDAKVRMGAPFASGLPRRFIGNAVDDGLQVSGLDGHDHLDRRYNPG